MWRLLIVILAITAVGCKKQSTNCDVPCTYTEQLLFQTGFNETTIVNGEYNDAIFSGADPDLEDANDWDEFQNHSTIGTAKISYEDGSDSQRLASVIDDPDSPGNAILKFNIKEPHIKEGSHKKGRVQLNVNNNKCIREIYQTVRVKFHSDMSILKEWEEPIHWLSIFEFWNNADWTKEKFPFRVTVNLNKSERGPVDNIFFNVKGDYKKNCKVCKWHDDWDQTNTEFPILFGEWMEIELYLKEGDKDNGRFYMAVTPEGGAKQVLFDITNRTQHEKEKCPDGYTQMQPLKLYTSDKLINYMSDQNKELSVYWDDWKFYINKTY